MLTSQGRTSTSRIPVPSRYRERNRVQPSRRCQCINIKSVRGFQRGRSRQGCCRNSPIIENLVRHTIDTRFCEKECGHSIINLVVEYSKSREGNCQRLTNVEILHQIQDVLAENNGYSEASKELARRASATFFANPFDKYIAQALTSKPLISLRNASHHDLESEARNALVGFFAQAIRGDLRALERR